MIFKHTLDQVLTGTKTETRRLPLWMTGDPWLKSLIKDLTLAAGPMIVKEVRSEGGRLKYKVGSTYAATPAMMKRAQGRIQILAMRYERLRSISLDGLRAEGFEDLGDFVDTWHEMYRWWRKRELPNRHGTITRPRCERFGWFSYPWIYGASPSRWPREVSRWPMTNPKVFCHVVENPPVLVVQFERVE